LAKNTGFWAQKVTKHCLGPQGAHAPIAMRQVHVCVISGARNLPSASSWVPDAPFYVRGRL